MNNEMVKIGISEMAVVQSPQKIKTTGLGSCVGIVVYDKYREIGGMAHILLPSSELAKNESYPPGKYADTAVVALIELLRKKGAANLKAKMAGGAQMFQLASAHDIMKIGERTVASVKHMLNTFKIPLLSEDVGGKYGRTIIFDPATAMLMIRTVHKGETVI